ncbi:hypothetical protein MCOR25_002895 [Pyricularia grisea]|uniref:PLD phosphodiesterase domain-containing protein n=1 Tax=Pyricularia grisea TaxID=148305 RepID=A0A6P8BCU2_PYRGI|nr:uncharacterized protein PgNI_04559 [Pyricularia grisea]KAI6375733.1 hypothetical protein MCOR25_002895 [Pyricularia grisea]TLD13522.1 hypothetical protein PgNI_04559 [Pyricularia grisea]
MDPRAAHALNGGDNEDDALRIAIALSLGVDVSSQDVEIIESRNRSNSRRTDAIDLTSDSPEPESVPAPQTEAKRPTSPPLVPSSTQSSIFGMDRKKMEEERLARLSKRKASDTEAHEIERPAQKPRLENEVAPTIKGSSAVPPTRVHNLPAANRLPFPTGVVKRTWLQGQSRSSQDITIEEVLQKDQLELAVLSSFDWDTEWLWTKVDPTKTKTTLIAFAGSEAEQERVAASAQGVARLCFPPMNGNGNMHSKLQLLKFPGYIRIVVPSGNLVPYDWGEQNGIIENSVFIIDLPPLKAGVKLEDNVMTSFGEELIYFLTAQGLNERIVSSLCKYDFSQTSRYAFVHTIAGVHTGDKWRRTGYCGLGRGIQNLGLATDEPVEIDFVASSIGSLKYGYLAALYNAFQGDSGLKDYQSRASKTKNTKEDAASVQKAKLRNCFRIYFPSLGTVETSRGGIRSAGTLCLRSNWWEAATFPRELFRDYENPRGALVHSKIIFARSPATSAAWAYVGSANISESAWGNLLVKDRASSQPKMSCRNWECGVIVPVGESASPGRVLSTGIDLGDASAGKGGSLHAHQGHISPQDQNSPAGISRSLEELFRECVPLPMKLPGRSYASAQDGKVPRPWCFDQAPRI